jgi:hypothetical protein
MYRNYIVHDPVSGTLATARKEELLLEIERQKELGDTGLLEEDEYLAEVNLEEMAMTSGERQHYWLLAIQTARNAKSLREQWEQQQTVRRNTMQECAVNYQLLASHQGQRCFLCSTLGLLQYKPSSAMLLRIATYTSA